MIPIDVDDKQTWPSEVIEVVQNWAERCRGTTEHPSDLDLRYEDESGFRSLFSARLLRTYHCTRLLPHEVSMIQRSGLRVLSAELLEDRIQAAEEAGVFTAQQALSLREGHVFAVGEHKNRENQTCFILSARQFRYDPDSCAPLLRTWGGEAIYMSSGIEALRKKLASIGSPAIVVANIDIAHGSNHLVFPALHKVFVGAELGLADMRADVFYRAAVPASGIEAIWTRGDHSFDVLDPLGSRDSGVS